LHHPAAFTLYYDSHGFRTRRLFDRSACRGSAPTPFRALSRYAASSAKSVSADFFAGVVVITTTLISTSSVPRIVRVLSASPPRKYPTSTATIGFTYA